MSRKRNTAGESERIREGVTGCELRVASYGLRVTGCELRVASYGLRVTGCELRVAGYELRACEHRAKGIAHIEEFGSRNAASGPEGP
jgi:hypothetical protein